MFALVKDAKNPTMKHLSLRMMATSYMVTLRIQLLERQLKIKNIANSMNILKTSVCFGASLYIRLIRVKN